MGASESKSLGSPSSSGSSWKTAANNGGNALLTVKEEHNKMIHEEEEDEATKEALKVAAAIAGVALVGWGLYRLFSSSSSSNDDVGQRILMKAPGRKGSHIFRDDFERDPSSYFKDLRFKDL